MTLNGLWQIRADAGNRGVVERWFERPPTEGWREIQVPSAWQTVFGTDETQDPGIAWYRRSVNLPPPAPNVRRFLRFDSVATDLTLWLDGRELGRHVGDWEQFEFELPPELPGGTPLELLARIDKIKPQPPVWINGAPVHGGHITKGFHDVLSLQHGGIWGSVALRSTGRISIRPRGVQILGNARDGSVRVRIDLYPHESTGAATIAVADQSRREVARADAPLQRGGEALEATLSVPSPRRWSPDAPTLYICAVSVASDGAPSDRSHAHFGFRTAATGGPGNQRVLLNDQPILIRGVLDWGHEPHHIAPAPTREELRTRFQHLREMGFNCVCVCMWYPPDHYYDIADETGMLVWQEHPVWKPPMGDELIEEYKRHFEHFFRRDVNHPSVILVSGACEHERFNPRLAEWWWGRARDMMPDRLLQVQTAFFAWSNLEQTDLYDEHTYDSSGRWTHYLEDLQRALGKMPPRPFIMGESVLYNDWPDVEALTRGPREWWYPKGLDNLSDAEREIKERWGSETLANFKAGARRFNLRGRKFQVERFRQYSNHAGLVSNHLNDVWSCRCGYSDDLGRWRFEPRQTRQFLADSVFLLRTPGGRSGFTSGYTLRAEIGMSNFGSTDFDREIELRISQGAARSVLRTRLACPRGEVRFVPVEVRLSPVDAPTKVTIGTNVEGCDNNSWEFWSLPEPGPLPEGVYRIGGVPSDPGTLELDFEEMKYSSGWGLPNESWKRRDFNLATLIPAAPVWHDGEPAPAGARLLITHALTPGTLDYLERGGRVLHLACRGPKSLPTKFLCMWGQIPLVLEHGPLDAGDRQWLCDLVDLDLTRYCTRAMPTDDLALSAHLDPLVRFMYVHDMTDRVKRLDALFSSRVGDGLLVVSTLDHGEEAGQYLLARAIEWMLSDDPQSSASLSRGHLEQILK